MRRDESMDWKEQAWELKHTQARHGNGSSRGESVWLSLYPAYWHMARMNELDKIVRNLVLLDVWVSLLSGTKLLQISESGISSTLPSRVSTYLFLKGQCCVVIEKWWLVYCLLFWEFECISLLNKWKLQLYDQSRGKITAIRHKHGQCEWFQTHRL